MKANELMIGDWVYEGKDHPVKVVRNYGRSIMYQEEYSKEVEERCLNPIPLTEEILKANGWSEPCYSKTGDNWHAWYQPYYDGGYEWNYSSINKNYDVRVTINYVHELQRALRLCGLNELADNFKLKEE